MRGLPEVERRIREEERLRDALRRPFAELLRVGQRRRARRAGWYRDGANGVCFSYGSLEYLFALDEATRRRSAELMAVVVAEAERSGTPRYALTTRDPKCY